MVPDVAGFVIGALARLIVPGKENLGTFATLALGLIGGLIARFFGMGDIWELNPLGFGLVVAAPELLIGVAEAVAGTSKRNAVHQQPVGQTREGGGLENR